MKEPFAGIQVYCLFRRARVSFIDGQHDSRSESLDHVYVDDLNEHPGVRGPSRFKASSACRHEIEILLWGQRKENKNRPVPVPDFGLINAKRNGVRERMMMMMMMNDDDSNEEGRNTFQHDTRVKAPKSLA